MSTSEPKFTTPSDRQIGVEYTFDAPRRVVWDVRTSCDHLPAGMSCDGFAVNDDGYLVWVGSGGLSSNAWGTNSGDVVVRGSQLAWGTPFAGECDDSITGERTQFCPVGKGPATWNMGFSSQLSWKGFTLYGLLDAVQDFEVYNMPLQWALFRRNIGMMDQTGVPEDQRKPIGYYDALYGVSGLVPSSEFVEDGSFVKLRELSLTYRLDGPRLAALSRSPVLGSVAISIVMPSPPRCRPPSGRARA
jgi:hypothetical protein